jgi:gas vesicle protein
MSQENNFGSGLFVGLLFGGALGAALALLYAPKTGKELRQDIKSRTDDYLDEADKYIAEAKDKAIHLINDGKKKSEKLIKEAKQKSEELLKDAEKVLDEAKSKTDEMVKSSKEKVEQKSGQIKGAIKAGVDAYKETKNT